MRKTTSLETACEVLGIPSTLPDLSTFPEIYQKEMLKKYQAQILADAINFENNNWQPNWDDTSQWKHEPRFYRSGGGWAYDGYDYWRTDSVVGSRLYFENEDDAEYFGGLVIKFDLI